MARIPEPKGGKPSAPKGKVKAGVGAGKATKASLSKVAKWKEIMKQRIKQSDERKGIKKK